MNKYFVYDVSWSCTNQICYIETLFQRICSCLTMFMYLNTWQLCCIRLTRYFKMPPFWKTNNDKWLFNGSPSEVLIIVVAIISTAKIGHFSNLILLEIINFFQMLKIFYSNCLNSNFWLLCGDNITK